MPSYNNVTEEYSTAEMVGYDFILALYMRAKARPIFCFPKLPIFKELFSTFSEYF